MRCVALFTRAWIEIVYQRIDYLASEVALFTRAWIEIFLILHDTTGKTVALFTRAWIEIFSVFFLLKFFCRPLYEGVD